MSTDGNNGNETEEVPEGSEQVEEEAASLDETPQSADADADGSDPSMAMKKNKSELLSSFSFARPADETGETKPPPPKKTATGRWRFTLEHQLEPKVRVKPHADGLFEADPPDEDLDSFELEVPYGSGPRNKIAMITIVVALLGILGHLIMITADESKAQEAQAFVDGTIEEFKTAEVKRLKSKWRDEDRAARNRYGDVTLTYFPADSTVKVTQVSFFQEGDAWRRKEAGRKEVGRKDLDNQTTKLTEGQTVERLPLLNLPLFEAEKNDEGDVKAAYTYEYEVEFSREGYYPQTKTWRDKDWQRIGPGNRIVPWSGLDLLPKPETIKANFAAAMGEIFCLMKLKELPTMEDASKDENFEILLQRNRIKNSEIFDEYKGVLMGGEHAEWWAEKQAEIAKQECQE